MIWFSTTNGDGFRGEHFGDSRGRFAGLGQLLSLPVGMSLVVVVSGESTTSSGIKSSGEYCALDGKNTWQQVFSSW